MTDLVRGSGARDLVRRHPEATRRYGERPAISNQPINKEKQPWSQE